LGFWLMAISFKFIGVSELAARLPSAITGILSVLLVYALGKKLFAEKVGFLAGIILTTMPWFWLRSRQGNLDIILTFFMLLTIWLALKVKENFRWLPLLAISFGFALLTKTIIAIGLLPVIFLTIYKPKKEISIFYLLSSTFCFLIILTPWYLINYQTYGFNFLDRNIFVTGLKLPGAGALLSKSTLSSFNFQNSFRQIQNGISLWYKPYLVAFFFGLIFLPGRSFQVLYLWLGIYLLLFSTSLKAELWHFIILYPAISLLISAFLFKVSEKLARKLSLFNFFFLLVSVFIFWNSYRIIHGLYKDIVKNQPINEEVTLSQLAGQNQGTIFIDDDYWPAAVFYSQRKVYSLPHSTDTQIKTVKQLFLVNSHPFQLLTKQWILNRDQIDPKKYEVLKQIGDRVLIKSR